MSELFNLVDDYMELHPTAETPLNLLSSLGVQRVTDIVKGAKGRVIIFQDPTENEDQASWSYGPEN